jgi:hypothetical protein
MYLSTKRKHSNLFGFNLLRPMFSYLPSFTVITIALRGDSISAKKFGRQRSTLTVVGVVD